MTNVPEIRFKGFSEPWKQRKLCEVCDMGTGYTPSKSNPAFWENGTIPWIRLEDIRKNGRILSDALQHVTPEAVKGKLIPAYSIIISTTATMGEHALPIVDSLANQQFTFITINVNCLKDLNPCFVFFVCYKLSDWCKTNTNSGGLLAVDMEGFKNWKISFPCMEEQDKIAKLMMELYNSIEHHKQKLDGLRKLKKGYIQQMFPQNGETMPKMRLKGFTEPWEQRELGDVVLSLKSGLSRMLSDEDIGLPVVRANNIVDGKLDMENDVKYWHVDDPQGAQTSNYLIYKDDILINFINSESRMGTAAIVTDNPSRNTIYTTNILNLRTNEYAIPYFIFTMTFSKKYKDYISSITKPAVSQASFTTVDFKNYIFRCPSVTEQIAIGNFFRNLDNQIITQSQKVEQLQQLQAAYLQKMFV